MSITRYSPYQRPAAAQLYTILDGSLSEMLNRVRKDFLSDSFFDDPEKWNYPKRDIINLDDRVEIVCTVPGLKREDIHLSVDNDVVWLKADKMETIYNKENIAYSQIKRSAWSSPIFKLSNSFSADAIDASLEDGLLTVVIPRKEAENRNSKEINIK